MYDDFMRQSSLMSCQPERGALKMNTAAWREHKPCAGFALCIKMVQHLIQGVLTAPWGTDPGVARDHHKVVALLNVLFQKVQHLALH